MSQYFFIIVGAVINITITIILFYTRDPECHFYSMTKYNCRYKLKKNLHSLGVASTPGVKEQTLRPETSVENNYFYFPPFRKKRKKKTMRFPLKARRPLQPSNDRAQIPQPGNHSFKRVDGRPWVPAELILIASRYDIVPRSFRGRAASAMEMRRRRCRGGTPVAPLGFARWKASSGFSSFSFALCSFPFPFSLSHSLFLLPFLAILISSFLLVEMDEFYSVTLRLP